MELEELKEELQEVKAQIKDLEIETYKVTHTLYYQKAREYERLVGQKMLLENLIGRIKIREKIK